VIARPVLMAAAAALAAVGLAACSGGGKKAATTTAATATTPSVSILTGSERTVTFPQLHTEIDRLYAQHPEIRNYVVQDVVYTPETRDKVLATCRLGAAATNARDREDSRVQACAPLIFFFYNFGRRKGVHASVEVARDLLWYAAGIKGPYPPLPPLTDLLQRWGVR
jgi:hypothetical protein